MHWRSQKWQGELPSSRGFGKNRGRNESDSPLPRAFVFVLFLERLIGCFKFERKVVKNSPALFNRWAGSSMYLSYSNVTVNNSIPLKGCT